MNCKFYCSFLVVSLFSSPGNFIEPTNLTEKSELCLSLLLLRPAEQTQGDPKKKSQKWREREKRASPLLFRVLSQRRSPLRWPTFTSRGQSEKRLKTLTRLLKVRYFSNRKAQHTMNHQGSKKDGRTPNILSFVPRTFSVLLLPVQLLRHQERDAHTAAKCHLYHLCPRIMSPFSKL